jgi:predicted Rdx family selenoprotein
VTLGGDVGGGAGGGGDYDVFVDSVLIFSKKKEGLFPNEGEVERLIKNQS